jgi:hypothetical protein
MSSVSTVSSDWFGNDDFCNVYIFARRTNLCRKKKLGIPMCERAMVEAMVENRETKTLKRN